MIVSLKADPNEDFGASSSWNVYFTIDGQDWELSLQNGTLSRAADFLISKRPDVIYGVGGVSYLRGFLNESVTETPSDGPGCG